MRTFTLKRIVDETGVSGTGAVAQGVVFDTGWVTLQWLTAINSIVFYPDIANVEHIHGHDGKTQIIYDDNREAHLERQIGQELIGGIIRDDLIETWRGLQATAPAPAPAAGANERSE